MSFTDVTFNTTFPMIKARLSNNLVEYKWNFTEYSSKNADNNFTEFNKWLTDILSKPFSNSDKIKIRNTNLIYVCLSDFYNQIFNSGYYKTVSIDSNFKTINLLTGLSQFSNSVFIQNIDQNLFTNGFIQPKFKIAVLSLLKYPSPFLSSEGKYGFKFFLYYEHYKNYKESMNKAAFLTEYINNFLKDNTGQISYTDSLYDNFTPNNIILTNPKLINLTIVNFSDESYNEIILDNDNIFETSFNYPNHMFGLAEITADISFWSPMSIIYFEKNLIPLSESVCNEISNQTGMLPASCYKNRCMLNNLSCDNDIEPFCRKIYSPPLSLTKSQVQEYLVIADFKNCRCLTSTLPPIDKRSFQNETALCFDNNCNSNIRSQKGLNDQICKTNCDIVRNWIFNRDENQSANLDSIDSGRLLRLCGIEYEPYKPEKFNKNIAIYTVLISTIFVVTVYTVCKYNNLRSSVNSLVTILSFIFCFGLSIFLSIDLAGKGSCEALGSFICKSKLTKKKIPDEFCNYKLNCECFSDTQCLPGCKCASTTCVPVTGVRRFENVNVEIKNIPFATSIFICFILVSIILYCTVKKDSIIVSIMFLIFGTFLTGIFSKKTEWQKKFSGSCLDKLD